jgi:hypothetical protein
MLSLGLHFAIDLDEIDMPVLMHQASVRTFSEKSSLQIAGMKKTLGLRGLKWRP